MRPFAWTGLASVAILNPLVDKPMTWGADWAWGLSLIVFTVTIHALGLGILDKKIIRRSGTIMRVLTSPAILRRNTTTGFIIVIGAATLSLAFLHAIETSIWALAYRLLNALPDTRSAMLYSLNAITSYGHVDLTLEDQWQMLGALEALNGWLLFGLTTAFLFAVINSWLSRDVKPQR